MTTDGGGWRRSRCFYRGPALSLVYQARQRRLEFAETFFPTFRPSEAEFVELLLGLRGG
jgi:hypothetical protein